MNAATAPMQLLALDGADDDGGTLYVLLDTDGSPVSCAAWPMPLEQLAADQGRHVERVTSPFPEPGLEWGPDDYDDLAEMRDDLMRAVLNAKTKGA